MYKKVDTNLNFVQREKEVEKFWDDNNIFEKSIDSRKKGESYVFYDGPPTASRISVTFSLVLSRI